jgi:tetratricopeptide (TPR) repeat protein
VIAVSPLNANALYSLGLSLEWQGKSGEALAYYKKVLNLNPDNAEIKKKIFEFEK